MSQAPSSSPAAEEEEHIATATITTSEELTRFAHYVQFRTRELRDLVQTFLGANNNNPNPTEPERMLEETEVTEEEDEQLFVNVGRFDDEFEDWVGVSEEAVAGCPEVREASYSFSHRPPSQTPRDSTSPTSGKKTARLRIKPTHHPHPLALSGRSTN
jgi:hypothetical protein